MLEKKRAEIQKELDLQLKMESNTGGGGGGVVMRKQLAPKEMIRKRKKVRSSSSSSSSSSDSGSSSDSSSSSSSKESRRKARKIKGGKRRQSSSSSSEDVRIKKVTKVKRLIHKKPTDPNKKLVQVKKLQITPGKLRKLSQSPTTTVLRKVPIKVSGSKLQGTKKVLVGVTAMSNAEKIAKHQRLKEQQQQQLLLQQQQQQMLLQQQQQQLLLRDKEKERENVRIREIELRERDRERERMRLKDKERGRSRSPRSPRTRIKSRSPRARSREIKYRSPPSRRSTSPRALSSQSRSGGNVVRRDRSIDRSYVRKDVYGKHDSRERERRDKERQEREAARDKERREALARCQERQRERIRLAKEHKEHARREREGVDRLIPRPADRALAIAAARGISRDKSDDRDRQRSHSNGRIGRERIDREKDHLSYDRNYERSEPRVYDSRDRGRINKDDGRPSREHERDRDYVLVRRRDERLETRNSPYGAGRDKRGDRDSNGAGRDLYISGSRYEDRVRDERRIAGPHEYPQSRGYIEDRHRPSERDREWIRDNVDGPHRDSDRSHIYERSNDRRHIRGEWERSEIPGHPRPNYSDHREWANNGGPGSSGGVLPPGERQWENNSNWQSDRDKAENWDTGVYNEPPEWQDHHRIDKNMEHPAGLPPGINRRWINWRGGGAPGRGRGGMQHVSMEYRRQMPLVQPPHDIIVAGAVAYDEHFKRIVHPAIITPTPAVQPEFTSTSQGTTFFVIFSYNFLNYIYLFN